MPPDRAHLRDRVQAYQTLQVWEDTPWGITSLGTIPDIGDVEVAIPVPQRGFPVGILTGPYGSCSNGDFSSHARIVVIVEIDGEQVPEFARIRGAERRRRVSGSASTGQSTGRATSAPSPTRDGDSPCPSPKTGMRNTSKRTPPGPGDLGNRPRTARIEGAAVSPAQPGRLGRSVLQAEGLPGWSPDSLLRHADETSSPGTVVSATPSQN